MFRLVIANAALYTLFMVADAGGFRVLFGILFRTDGAAAGAGELPTELLKYASVCVCFVISVLVMKHAPHGRDARLQVLVLAFTLAADLLILFTPHYKAGIAVFCGAHLTATYRYAGARGARRAAVIAGAAAAAIAVIAALSGAFGAAGQGGQSAQGNAAAAPLLYAVAAAPYALLIASATVSAYRRRQPRINNLLSRLGMTLFVLCDVNVLLWNLRGGMDMTAIPAWTGTLMWTFYLPAQTMLALSAYEFEDGKSPSTTYI
jgi:hypothetical protein